MDAIPGSMAELLAGRVDLALGPRPATGVEGFKVDESTVVVLVSGDQRWAQRAQIPISDLREQPLLLIASRDSFSRSAIERACHRAGFEPTIKLESASPRALARLAEEGIGVAAIPDVLVPVDFTGRQLPISGAGDLLDREVWLCWRAGALTAPGLIAFVAEARRVAEGRQGRDEPAR